MTTATIEPITLDKLAAFKRRRRGLLLLRGLCAGMVTLLVSMTFVAVLDLLVVMSDQLRTGLSIGAYALTLLAIWQTSLRRLFHRENARELARLVEAAEPGLREDLISAVELGSEDDRPAFDSPAFRQLLQKDVANRMRHVQVGALLPPSLVFTWVLSASIAILTCLTLLVLPDTPFRHMLARAMVPTASLDRVTAIRINLIEPGPDDRVVAEGDTVDVRVQLSGPEPRRGVVLHTRDDQGRSESAMEAVDEGIYAGRIRIDEEAVTFRVTADDATTRRYRIEPKPRPRPVAFTKTFDYPEYTRLDDETRSESHGNIEVLSGTEVTLVVHADQPLESAGLLWVDGDEVKPDRLRAHGDDAAMIRFTVDDTEGSRKRYRLELTAERTGFTNRYSPEFEVRAIPDQPPSIHLEEPEGTVSAPPDGVIRFRGEADDDLGLSKVIRVVDIDGKRREQIVAEDPGPSHAFNHHLDLFELGAEPGDRFTVRFAALDLRESRTETGEVTVTVSSAGFDPDRLQPVQSRARALEAIETLQQAGGDLGDRFAAHVARAGEGGGDRRGAIHEAMTTLEELQAFSEAARDATLGTLEHASPGRDGADLVRIARQMVLIEQAHLGAARALLERALDDDGPAGAVMLDEARQRVEATPELAAGAAGALRPIHAVALASLIHADLQRLMRDHREWRHTAALLDPDDEHTTERLARRHAVATGHMREVRALIEALPRDGDEQVGATVNRVLEQWQQKRLDWLVEAEGDLDRLKQANAALAAAAASAMQQLLPVQRTLVDELDAARASLDDEPAGALRRQVEQITAAEDQSLQHVGLAASARYLRSLGTIEQRRPVGDRTFIGDVNLAARSLDAATAAPDAQALETAERVYGAFEVLEAGHHVHEMSAVINELLKRERWDRRSYTAGTDHPADWRFAVTRRDAVAARLEHPDLPQQAAPALRDALGSEAADEVSGELNARLGATRDGDEIEAALKKVNDDVAAVLAMIRPAMAQARLDAAADQRDLPEQLADLAREMEAAEQRMAELAEAAAEGGDAGQAAAEAAELAAERRQTQQQMEQIAEAIGQQMRDHDFLDPEGRERIRDDAVAAAALRQAEDPARDRLQQAGAGTVRAAATGAPVLAGSICSRSARTGCGR